MSDTPLPAEEGGRPTCAYCGKFSSEMVLRADGSYTCFNQCRMASPASVVGDASEGEADAVLADAERFLRKAHAWNGTAIEAGTLLTRALASLHSTRAALEEAREDAERYRYIRPFLTVTRCRVTGFAQLDCREWMIPHLRKLDATVDEIIDAARAIPSQESEKV